MPGFSMNLQPSLSSVCNYALGTQEDVALDTPMISEIARRVLNHTNADVPKMLCTPVGQPAFAFVLDSLDLRPFSGAEGDVRHLHIDSSISE